MTAWLEGRFPGEDDPVAKQQDADADAELATSRDTPAAADLPTDVQIMALVGLLLHRGVNGSVVADGEAGGPLPLCSGLLTVCDRLSCDEPGTVVLPIVMPDDDVWDYKLCAAHAAEYELEYLAHIRDLRAIQNRETTVNDKRD